MQRIRGGPTSSCSRFLCFHPQGVAQLTQLILARATPKRFGAALMTGPLRAGLVGAYSAAMNAGAVPTIATAWQVCLTRARVCPGVRVCVGVCAWVCDTHVWV